MNLKKYVGELKEIRDKHLKFQELDSLIRDIRVLEESIRSNVNSFDIAEKELVLNNEIRDRLQKNLISIHVLQSKKLVRDLKLACKMLSHERKDLYMQNLEMKKRRKKWYE